MKSWIFENGKITICADEEKLLKQSIYNMLTIPVGDYMIYSLNFGNQMLNNLNRGYDILSVKASEYLENALLIDNRIKGVSNIETKIIQDKMEVKFNVFQQNGQKINIESEVYV